MSDLERKGMGRTTKARARSKNRAGQKSSYGAGKCKNEVYFQMASVFRAVSRDENRLAGVWMARIMNRGLQDISGKNIPNVI